MTTINNRQSTITIGTRGSALALAQAKTVADAITAQLGLRTELVVIKTQGDRVTDRPLRELEWRGYFTKEIEEALLTGKIDLAVHSFKDLPSKMPYGLVLAAVTEREDPGDVLICDADADVPPFNSPPRSRGENIRLKEGTVVGTSAVRRAVQLKSMRPDLAIKDLRGNVPTRLKRLSEGKYDAIMLACAGINRLNPDLSKYRVTKLDPTVFIPSPGQGALAVQMREGDTRFEALHSLLHHEPTGIATSLEREVMVLFGGGCGLPLGVYARQVGEEWEIHGFWGGNPERPVWATVKGKLDDGLTE